MRVLLVASNDDRAQTMRGLLTASESHAFDVVYASSPSLWLQALAWLPIGWMNGNAINLPGG
jgi:hypothetical protein